MNGVLKYFLLTLMIVGLANCTKREAKKEETAAATPAAGTATPGENTQTVDNKTAGNTEAKKGGVFYMAIDAEPTTLHPIKATDFYARYIRDIALDTLLVANPETNELEPGLAESYEADPKGMWYIFHLRKNVKFHDGQPVTAKDVKFSYDCIMDDAFQVPHLRPYYENVKNAEIIDDYTVKFNIKQKYFGNFRSVGGLYVIPYHFYKDPKANLNKVIVGTGPYLLKKDGYKKGKSLEFTRNPDWWGNSVPAFKNAFNYDKWFFRIVQEENTQLALLAQGKLDFMELSPEQFVQKTNGKPWGDKVLKVQAENSVPKSYGFVGWNMTNDLFKDRNVRVALAHLMNRDLMNEKFRFGMSLPATGPWYLQSPYANPAVEAIKFDPKKAEELLKAAGWSDSDKDGMLDKMIDGQKRPFRFSLMYASPDSEKYFTLYKEDMKKAGIEMELKRIEWNSFIKALDEKKFEAVALSWGGGEVDLDPKQIWHSSSASAGGSNFISYSNKEVDELIEKGDQELDLQKRIKIFQEVYKKIADDAPYAFLFNNKYYLYANTARMKKEKDSYKFLLGREFWWLGDL